MVPDLSLGKVGVRVQARDVTCCTGNTCCIGVRSRASPDPITVTVRDEDEKDVEVELSPSSEMVYIEVDGRCFLRPIRSSDRKRGIGRARHDDMRRKFTLEKYYDALIAEYGHEAAAIATAWQGIDFANMYAHAMPLQLSHVVALCDGLKYIKKIAPALDRVLHCCKNLALVPVSVRLPEIGSVSPKAIQVSLDSTTSEPEDSDEVDEEKVKPVISLETPGLKGTITPIVDLEASTDKAQQELVKVFFEISSEKGLMTRTTAKLIGHKLIAILKNADEAKRLPELAHVKNFTHLTKEDAESLIRLGKCIDKTLKTVKAKRDAGSKIDTILEAFAREPVSTEFKESPRPNQHMIITPHRRIRSEPIVPHPDFLELKDGKLLKRKSAEGARLEEKFADLAIEEPDPNSKLKEEDDE